jgi:hypothetical protein
LRLRLNGTDGTVRDAVIRVQVRNYSSGPTPTASVVPTGPAALVVETPVIAAATETATRPALQTPTPFPRNPAALTGTDVLGALARGGIAIIAAFLLWGAITLRRRM